MDITILSNVELQILWGIAIVMPLSAHWAVRNISRSLGIEAGRTLPRVMLLTTASVLTLLWLTGSRFSSIELENDVVQLNYAVPGGRTRILPREDVAEVFLTEDRFPRLSYALHIEARNGDRYQSVGVTAAGLRPLYEVLDSFHPGTSPYVALRRENRPSSF